MTNEGDFSRKVQNALRKEGWYVVKYHGGTFSVKGTPDLLVCANGLFIGIELKAEYGITSELQKIKGKEIVDSGGIWLVVVDTDDEIIPNLIDHIKKEIKKKLSAIPFKLLV